MNLDAATEIISRAIELTLLMSLPSVTLGLLVGLLIAVFQAVTQIQEQTLTFVPKMVVVFLVIAFTFPWMSSLALEFTVSLWKNIPQYAR